MTVTRRLFTAGLPAAGMIAATLALTGQAASAAPQDLGFGDAPEVDAARAWLTAVAGSAAHQAAPISPVDLPQEALLGAPSAGPLGAVGGAGPLGGAGNGASGAGVSGLVSGDNDGILNGTQIAVPIQAPINVCGTGVGILGVGRGDANCGAAALPPTVDEPPVDEPPVVDPPVGEPPAVTPPVRPAGYGPPELPVTGGPLMGLAGLGGLLTAGGAAMSIAGARVGVGAARYSGRHRSAG